MQACKLCAGAWAEEVAASGSAADRKALALAITLSRRVSHPVADALVALGDSLEKLRRAQHEASNGGLPHLQISGFRTGTGEFPAGLSVFAVVVKIM